MILIQQFILKEGLMKFGEYGENLLLKELTQHHNMKMFTPSDGNNMIKKEQSGALR